MGPGFLADGRAAVARHLDQTGDGDARDAGGAGGALRAGELLPAAVLSGFTALLHHCHDLAGTKRSGARRMAGDGRPGSVLGGPTSAGSHNPGQEKAPAARRAAGPVRRPPAAGPDGAGRGDRYRRRRPGRVVLFGFDPAELDTGQWTELASRPLYAAPAPAVGAAPAGEARRARAYLGRRSDSYLVHFDVDVLHTGLFP